MKVRLKGAAVVPHASIPGGHWMPAGSVVHIPDEHFSPELHEPIEDPPEPVEEPTDE